MGSTCNSANISSDHLQICQVTDTLHHQWQQWFIIIMESDNIFVLLVDIKHLEELTAAVGEPKTTQIQVIESQESHPIVPSRELSYLNSRSMRNANFL